MKRFNIDHIADGLTAYAIERRNGIERHQHPGEPSWAERRRFWTDAILQGMARLEGLCPDSKRMEQFDQRLEEARSCTAVEALSLKDQRSLIHELNSYVSALETAGGDRRRQIDVVRELLEDMACCLPWADGDNGLDQARDQTERTLARMTAQMPIRFTRILLGGDAGPHWADGFVSGAVKDAEAVRPPEEAPEKQDLLLQGERPLGPDDLAIYELYNTEDGCLTFCIDVLADETEIFGRQLSNDQAGSYIMGYAVYDESTGQVNDTLDIELRLPRGESWYACHLSQEVRDALKEKMDRFVVERYGEHLPEPSEGPQPRMEQTM